MPSQCSLRSIFMNCDFSKKMISFIFASFIKQYFLKGFYFDEIKQIS